MRDKIILKIAAVSIALLIAVSCATVLVAVSISDVSPSQVTLILGETVTGELEDEGSCDYYQVYVGSGEHLFVVLEDLSDECDKNELYIKYGSLPNRTNYDDKFDIPDNPDQAVEINNTQAGYYYVLVYADFVYESSGTRYNITAYTNANLPTLTSGVTITDELRDDESCDYYQVHVGSDEHLFVVLEDLSSHYDENELYIKYGSLPNRTNYDDKFDISDNPDQAVEINNTQAGYYYVLVYADYVYKSSGTRYNITAYTNANLPTLTSGVTVTDELRDDESCDYYQVYVGSGEHLFVVLEDLSDECDKNELYIKYGSLPNRTNYDDKFDIPDNPDQAVEINNTQAGYYYVLVYADFVYESSGTRYNITAYTNANLPTLTSGVTITDELRDDESCDYYQVHVGSDEHLFVVLEDLSSHYDENELYIKYGSLPNRTNYDDKFDISDNPDQAVEINNTQAGYYYVLVYADYVYKSSGTRYNITAYMTGMNNPPVASFNYSPRNPVVNQTITFNASSSYDPDGSITNYEWDFGDGNITNTTEAIITHYYSQAGNYTVNLTVTDDEGATNSTNKTITIYPPTPTPTPPAEHEVYPVPQSSNAPYCSETDIGIWVNATNFQGGQIKLTYDSTCANVTNWAMNTATFPMGGWTHSVGDEWITFTAMSGLTGEHLIGTLTIHCVSEEECSTPLDFVTTGTKRSKLIDPHGNEITGVNWKDGTFGCTVGICGDVAPYPSGNEIVDMGDVIRLLNHVNRPGDFSVDSWAGDCKCSGVIDMGDVILLLNHVNNLDEFPLECCE